MSEWFIDKVIQWSISGLIKMLSKGGRNEIRCSIMEQIPSEGSSYPNHNAWIGSVFSGNMTRHLAPVLVMLFGSCQLILFVSKTNYFQILKRQCYAVCWQNLLWKRSELLTKMSKNSSKRAALPTILSATYPIPHGWEAFCQLFNDSQPHNAGYTYLSVEVLYKVEVVNCHFDEDRLVRCCSQSWEEISLLRLTLIAIYVFFICCISDWPC